MRIKNSVAYFLLKYTQAFKKRQLGRRRGRPPSINYRCISFAGWWRNVKYNSVYDFCFGRFSPNLFTQRLRISPWAVPGQSGPLAFSHSNATISAPRTAFVLAHSVRLLLPFLSFFFFCFFLSTAELILAHSGASVRVYRLTVTT